jgi:hypothetical protein
MSNLIAKRPGSAAHGHLAARSAFSSVTLDGPAGSVMVDHKKNRLDSPSNQQLSKTMVRFGHFVCYILISLARLFCLIGVLRPHFRGRIRCRHLIASGIQ